MTKPWTAVIPSDSVENLEPCLQALVKAHPHCDEGDIVVVSRKIKEPFVTPKFTLVRDPVEAFNFARRANFGILKAGKKDVVLMGDDVEVVTPNAFDLMMEEASFRILSASVRGRVGPWWQREGQNSAEVPFVSFICVYLPRPVLRIIGEFDEGFPGYGYEDTDYCVRAKRKGLSVGVCGRAVVEHGVRIKSSFMEAFKAELPGMEDAARRAFLQKWREGV